jgi:hypothetical protein
VLAIGATWLHEAALSFQRDWDGYVPVGPAAQDLLERIGRALLAQNDISLSLDSRINIQALRLRLHAIAEQVPPGGRLPVNLQIHNRDGLFVEDAEAIYLKREDGTWRVSIPGPGPEYNPRNASVHIPWVQGEGSAPDLNALLDPRVPDSQFDNILRRYPGKTVL